MRFTWTLDICNPDLNVVWLDDLIMGSISEGDVCSCDVIDWGLKEMIADFPCGEPSTKYHICSTCVTKH